MMVTKGFGVEMGMIEFQFHDMKICCEPRMEGKLNICRIIHKSGLVLNTTEIRNSDDVWLHDFLMDKMKNRAMKEIEDFCAMPPPTSFWHQKDLWENTLKYTGPEFGTHFTWRIEWMHFDRCELYLNRRFDWYPQNNFIVFRLDNMDFIPIPNDALAYARAYFEDQLPAAMASVYARNGTTIPAYSELIRINQYLHGKKSVSLVMTDGQEIKCCADIMTAKKFICCENHGLRLFPAYLKGDYPVSTSLQDINHLRYKKQILKLDTEALLSVNF